MNVKAEAYFTARMQWREELLALRSIILSCGLSEDFKWNRPCYTFENGNVVSVAPLKDHCWALFFKGALLVDPSGRLVKAGDNSHIARVIKFRSVGAVADDEPLLRTLINQAIEVEKSGQKVDVKAAKTVVHPDELIQKLEENPAFKAAFLALTPGRQRAYNLHFSQPKQSKTRLSRIEKCMPDILVGKGLNDFR